MPNQKISAESLALYRNATISKKKQGFSPGINREQVKRAIFSKITQQDFTVSELCYTMHVGYNENYLLCILRETMY